MSDELIKIEERDSNKLVAKDYQDYAKYVLETRALPSVEDGLKLVQRRIIYAANQQPQKLMKTAALAGKVMLYHPHGDSTGAIYTMTYPYNRQKIFNIKGNHGGPGWSASAGRYTECYLNDIGRFNYCQFLEYAEYEDGELGIPEPKALPCLIPYGIVEGSSGMGVGLSSDIIPLNLLDLIDCYREYISTGNYKPEMVRPDPGPYLIENNADEIKQSVDSSRGKLTAVSVIVRESPTKISIGEIPGRSIESLIDKLGWWITDEYVIYTNESTDKVRHTFEIVNDKKGEITLDDLVYWVEKYTTSNKSYIRCMVDTDKSAIFCSLKYVMDKSLDCLNKAIDKWISTEISRTESKLALYRALALAKSKNVFEDAHKISSEVLVGKMVSLGIEEEIAKEIMRKPISYLTRDHDSEMDELLTKLDELKNHNRTEYLMSLYDTFREMILDDHNSKKHSLVKSDVLSRPKIRLADAGKVEVYQDKRSGYELGNKVYLVGKSGWLYIRVINSPVKAVIDLNINEPIVGISTDKYTYLELQTKKGKKGVSYEIANLDKEKYLVKLQDGESVVLAQGWNNPPKEVSNNLVTKMSQSRWY